MEHEREAARWQQWFRQGEELPGPKLLRLYSSINIVILLGGTIMTSRVVRVWWRAYPFVNVVREAEGEERWRQHLVDTNGDEEVS